MRRMWGRRTILTNWSCSQLWWFLNWNLHLQRTGSINLYFPMTIDESLVGWANFSKSSQIEPLFLYSMCMGKIRSHAKFQVSSFNILKWQPLFVNQSWQWESHLKWPESGIFHLVPFIGIKNGLQNGITLGVLDYRKYVKRLDGNW